VTLIDTGNQTLTGDRIKCIESYVGENFCLTYGDGLSSVNIKQLINLHKKNKKLATVLAVKPIGRFGIMKIKDNNVTKFLEKPTVDEEWINGGFFVLNKKIFKYIGKKNSVWEKEPLENLSKDVSKVVDSNGEPLICYHGTPDGRFTIFDENKFGSRTRNINSIAFFFTPSLWYAEAYSEKHNNEAIKIYEDMFGEKPRAVEPRPYAEEKMCFLNVKNPYYASSQTKEDLTYAKINNFDGLILKYKNKDEIFEIASFSSNQIKIADGTNTTFDANNPDIRYESGGGLFKPHKNIEQIAKEKNVSLPYAKIKLNKGMKIESEHSNDKKVQEIIALQHLDENIKYYDKIK
jgi:hypothetical protein